MFDPQDTSAPAPNALFDLAVNRAYVVLRDLKPQDIDQCLAQWHARTRFARRIPLTAVTAAVALRPDHPGQWHWVGGPQGQWVQGKAPFP